MKILGQTASVWRTCPHSCAGARLSRAGKRKSCAGERFSRAREPPSGAPVRFPEPGSVRPVQENENLVQETAPPHQRMKILRRRDGVPRRRASVRSPKNTEASPRTRVRPLPEPLLDPWDVPRPQTPLPTFRGASPGLPMTDPRLRSCAPWHQKAGDIPAAEAEARQTG
jgi:hypothetical protein